MTVTPLRSNYLAVYERRRSEILELAQRQLEICDALGRDEAQADGQRPAEQLRGVLTRLETDRLASWSSAALLRENRRSSMPCSASAYSA